MKIEQLCWTPETGWSPDQPGALADADFVLAFGSTEVLSQVERLRALADAYPRAAIVGCSTAGEIYGTSVYDGSLVVTAVELDRSEVRAVGLGLDGLGSMEAGRRLGRQLAGDKLAHVLVFSEGLEINGSELVRGLLDELPDEVQVTGGLAGDGERFGTTLVVEGGQARSGRVAALGLYGDFRVGYGSLGGWDPFGPERLITRSRGNVLVELDGRSALGLYKMYLGDYARDLPASALLFPLSLRAPEGGSEGVVRTVLRIDEEEGTMTFAGDVPEGYYARLMKANFERLIDGAIMAAKTSFEAIGSTTPDLALLISCVGRKMVLKQRIEEEIESVREILGDRTVLSGFYSYGEISPFAPTARCELHNQTMTITTLSEG